MSLSQGNRIPIGFQRAPVAPIKSADRPARVAPVERWVEPYCLCVFAFMFVYVIFGIPGADTTDSSQTDRVSPVNSLIWLTVLILALPVLRVRWREILAVVQGSWILLLLFGYFTLSITWALDPGASLRRVMFTYVQFFEMAIILTGVRRTQRVHIVIATICCICAIADLLAYGASPSMTMTDEGFAGLQGQKNQAGLLMMYGYLSSMTCIFLVKPRLLKVFYLGSSLIMCVLLAMTRSSTSESVVVGATIVIPMILLIAKLPKSAIQAIAMTFILSLVAGVFGFVLFCGFTGYDLLLPFRGMTFTARTDIWAFVIEEIQKRPWFGSGYSSFWAIDPRVQPSMHSDGWFGVYVVISEGHNGYLDLLATCGIFGFVFGLFVVFRTIYLAGRALNWTQQAPPAWRAGMITQPTAVFHLAYLLGLLLHNFTESNLFSNNGALAVAFLIAAVDLEKWRVTARARGFEFGIKRRATRIATPPRGRLSALAEAGDDRI